MPKLSEKEQSQAAKEFFERWKDRGREKQDDQSFWNDLLHDVLGIEKPSACIEYQKPVPFENTTKYIDGYIKTTKILIEQKGNNVDLSKGERQSDGVFLRPDQQARRYANNLPYDEKPRYIIVSNFKEIWVYDENHPYSDPEKIALKDLPKEYYRLQFIVDTGNVHIKKEMELSIKAGEIVGEFYNALRNQYHDPDDPETLKSLNKLCVRLVFCLYAEDAGLFGHKSAFHDYLDHYDVADCRDAVKALFNVLNQKPEDRDKYLKPELASFPYVNGGLFDGEDIEIPQFTEEIRDLILAKASDDFDWSEISPTIFGAVFESTLNPETRRKGGMHYTSIENIHKVIDPLFYDALCKEFEEIKETKVTKTRNQKLEEFRDKLASLTFLDPACGSGNFLTETYLSLRRLENEAIQLMQDGKISFGFLNPIKVQISQFYGIEINDFAVTVAKTALWIAESQMMRKTEEIMAQDLDFLPLKTYTNIVEGNALRVEWSDVVPAGKLSYIMGNPPFVGSSRTDGEDTQKEDMQLIFNGVSGAGKLDYVAAWYMKAAKLIQNTKISCAFVSTNSITQGEQVSLLWKTLFEQYGITIHFAYRSFKWESESSDSAAVVCIIIGFANYDSPKKYIFDGKRKKRAKHINGYLCDLDDFYIKSRSSSIFPDIPKIIQGNKPWDGGHLLLSEDDAKILTQKYPQASLFVKNFYGGDELVKGKRRYCLWLNEVEPIHYAKIPEIIERLRKVADARKITRTAAVQKQAETPALFSQIRHPNSSYLAIPEVTTSARKYIPMAFLGKDDIASNKIFMIPGADLHLFGILTSNIHMAWMRVVSGRLGTGYSYSPSVYNNFPWIKLSQGSIAKIEKTAQNILDIRKKYPNTPLNILYSEQTMPADLRKAHQANDRAVMEAYGFWGKLNSESECVAELMKMYQELTESEKQ